MVQSNNIKMIEEMYKVLLIKDKQINDLTKKVSELLEEVRILKNITK